MDKFLLLLCAGLTAASMGCSLSGEDSETVLVRGRITAAGSATPVRRQSISLVRLHWSSHDVLVTSNSDSDGYYSLSYRFADGCEHKLLRLLLDSGASGFTGYSGDVHCTGELQIVNIEKR